jgi:hypothetical protein
VDRHGGFAALLRRDYPTKGDNLAQASHWYADAAARYHVCTERNLSEFALRLASQPQRLFESYGGDLNGFLNEIRGNPTILRGARLLALLCANQNRSEAARLLPRLQS